MGYKTGRVPHFPASPRCRVDRCWQQHLGSGAGLAQLWFFLTNQWDLAWIFNYQDQFEWDLHQLSRAYHAHMGMSLILRWNFSGWIRMTWWHHVVTLLEWWALDSGNLQMLCSSCFSSWFSQIWEDGDFPWGYRRILPAGSTDPPPQMEKINQWMEHQLRSCQNQATSGTDPIANGSFSKKSIIYI